MVRCFRSGVVTRVQDYGYGGQGGGYGGYDGGHAAGGREENVWGAQGYPTPGPNGWVMYREPGTGEPYYHNHNTKATQWDRPAEWPAAGPSGQ